MLAKNTVRRLFRRQSFWNFISSNLRCSYILAFPNPRNSYILAPSDLRNSYISTLSIDHIKEKNADQPFLTDRHSQSLITHAQAFRLPLFHFPLISPI